MNIVSVLQNTNFYYYEFSDSNSLKLSLRNVNWKIVYLLNLWCRSWLEFYPSKIKFLSTLLFIVHVFWEGRKNWPNLHRRFEVSNRWWIFCQICDELYMPKLLVFVPLICMAILDVKFQREQRKRPLNIQGVKKIKFGI